MALQHLRSNTASKRPTASSMSDGQLAINTNATSPGLFFKDAGGALIKVGPVHIGTSAPNSVPAGSSGNAVGEQWLDTSGGGYVFKIWDGTAWRSETGQFVDVAGDTMTGNLTISGADLIMSNGEIVAETGSAATPSITFSGDLNTGIYSPGADQVAISTNGTGRVFVDSSGNVGIAIDNPTNLLTVASGAINTANSIDTNNQIRIGVNDSTGYSAYLSYGQPSTVTANSYALSISAKSNNNDANILLAKDGGNVGIGTSSPGTKLDVDGSGAFDDNITIRRGSSAPAVVFNNSSYTGNDGSIAYFNTGSLLFSTNGNERLRITSDGNVGIGTSSPGTKLHVEDNNDHSSTYYLDADAGVLVTNSGSGKAVLKLQNEAAIVYGSSFGNNLIFAQRENERLRIDSSGRLLVGTSTSVNALIQAGLQVQSTGAKAYASIGRWDNNTSNPGLIFNKSRGGSVGALGVVQSGDNLGEISFTGDDGSAFVYGARIQSQVDGTPGLNDMPGRLVFSTTADGASSPTERLRIASNGNIGIGTTNPQYPLDIAGNMRFGLSSGYALIQYGRDSTNTDNWHVGSEGDGSFRFYNGVLGSGSEKMRINSSGNVGIGTSNPTELLSIAGSNNTAFGIKISSGTQAATIKQDASGNLDVNNNLARALILSTSNAERARIDSSGRLLVGTSSALGGNNATVQIAGKTSSAGLQITRFNSNDGCIVDFSSNRNINVNSYTTAVSGDELARLRFLGYDGANQQLAAQITANVDGTPGTNDMPGRLVFSTTADGASSPTERMRITSEGAVYIGETDRPNGTTRGGAGFYPATSDRKILDLATTTTGTSGLVVFYNGNGQVGSITTNGSATAYNTSSDYRLKENVTAVTDGITRLQQLKPSRFNFIADPDKTVDGFLAHEVQGIVPEAITGDKDAVDDEGNPEYQGIDQSKLVPLLTAALQEAIGEIESLKARVAALESA